MRAFEEAHVIRDWSVRRAEAAGMLNVIAGALATAWLLFALGGFLVLAVMVFAGFDPSGINLVVAALVAVILTLAYFASSLDRQAKILDRALHRIADLDE